MHNLFYVINVLLVLRNYEKKKLLEYLSSKSDNKKSIDLKKLSDTALMESERMKGKFPVVPTFFASIFVALINSFFGWMFKQDNLKTISEALILLGISTYFILISIMLYLMLSSAYFTARDDIFNRDSKKMKILSELLSEIENDLQQEREN